MIGMHTVTTINIATILIPISFLITSIGIDTTFDSTIRIILFKGSCTHMTIKLFRPKYAKYCPPIIAILSIPKEIMTTHRLPMP